MSVLPARHDFTIWHGATFRSQITVYTGASLSSGLRDLSGYTSSLVIKDKPGGTVLLTLDTSNGGITLGGALGTIDLFIDAAITAVLTWKTGVYDLTITSVDTDALLWGHWKVKTISA